ncbi:hypothetical protein [Pseudaminobacter sp. NGMCC 1.201702]
MHLDQVTGIKAGSKSEAAFAVAKGDFMTGEARRPVSGQARTRNARQLAGLYSYRIFDFRRARSRFAGRRFLGFSASISAPDEEKNRYEISCLKQNCADHGLYERGPERLRENIGGDRKHQQHADKATKEKQKGHCYPSMLVSCRCAAKIMRARLPPKHALIFASDVHDLD